MKHKNTLILFAIMLSMTTQASDNGKESPRTIIHNFDKNFVLKNDKQVVSCQADIDDDDIDDDKFYDAQEESHELLQQNIFSLRSQDIENADEFTGFNIYFDDLYQYAKRDLYLAQQHERMFPHAENSYENLKKYVTQLQEQRMHMAFIRQTIKNIIGNHHDRSFFHGNNFDKNAQYAIAHLQKKCDQIYHDNVRPPTMNPKNLSGYKVPYKAQLLINKLKLQEAQIYLDQVKKLAA